MNADDKAKITDILLYINKLYTVYTRLFIYDIKGTIVAESNLHNDPLDAVGQKGQRRLRTGDFFLALAAGIPGIAV